MPRPQLTPLISKKIGPRLPNFMTRLTQKSPETPRYSYRLGVALRAIGQNEQALRGFQQAQADGLPLSLVGFEMACAYAALGQKDKAFDTLAAAVQQGFGQPDKLNTEPALQTLQSDPRFAELVARPHASRGLASITPQIGTSTSGLESGTWWMPPPVQLPAPAALKKNWASA